MEITPNQSDVIIEAYQIPWGAVFILFYSISSLLPKRTCKNGYWFSMEIMDIPFYDISNSYDLNDVLWKAATFPIFVWLEVWWTSCPGIIIMILQFQERKEKTFWSDSTSYIVIQSFVNGAIFTFENKKEKLLGVRMDWILFRQNGSTCVQRLSAPHIMDQSHDYAGA